MLFFFSDLHQLIAWYPFATPTYATGEIHLRDWFSLLSTQAKACGAFIWTLVWVVKSMWSQSWLADTAKAPLARAVWRWWRVLFSKSIESLVRNDSLLPKAALEQEKKKASCRLVLLSMCVQAILPSCDEVLCWSLRQGWHPPSSPPLRSLAPVGRRLLVRRMLWASNLAKAGSAWVQV